ncbi:MAG: hypothetical protein AAF799_18030 [Myxococcota bacterium]
MVDLRLAFAAVLLSIPLAGCDDDDGGPLVATVSNDECVSGRRWVGGNEGSPQMHPGGDCIACHATNGGPEFLIAGTVYELFAEPNECFGFEGATVEIVDANGREISLPTNEAGNFYLAANDGPVAMPYRASVVVNGATRLMNTMQVNGSCSSCHTATGASGAPGRIVIP